MFLCEIFSEKFSNKMSTLRCMNGKQAANSHRFSDRNQQFQHYKRNEKKFNLDHHKHLNKSHNHQHQYHQQHFSSTTMWWLAVVFAVAAIAGEFETGKFAYPNNSLCHVCFCLAMEFV